MLDATAGSWKRNDSPQSAGTMLTIFSTPKPFVGHIDVIQRNAIQSWKRLDPGVEVILVGDDPGTAEVCAELGLRHIAQVQRNQHGTKYLASIYDQAQDAARHEILCHVNCDIILMSDFIDAVRRVRDAHQRFLMAGQRWDLDVREHIDFLREGWQAELRRLAHETDRQRPAQWIDYFVFRKGLFYDRIPEFVIGRPGWDNWLLWYPRSIDVPVIDASRVVMAVHQNHDYGYHPDGEKGVWEGEEAQQNYLLHQGKYATLAEATYVLTPRGLRPNFKGAFVRAKRKAAPAFYRVWFALLDLTRPIRARLGLRSGAAAQQKSAPGEKLSALQNASHKK
jgi:hypothetical protein